MSFYVPVLFAIVGTVLYHLSQKTMPAKANAFFCLAWAFGLACVLSLVLWRITNRQQETAAGIPWQSLALGFSLVSIEAGYLFAYRLGWQLNRAALGANVTVAILLLLIGSLFFGEQISFRVVAGISSCLIGLALLLR